MVIQKVGSETMDLVALTPAQREKAEKQLAQLEARKTSHLFAGKGKKCKPRAKENRGHPIRAAVSDDVAIDKLPTPVSIGLATIEEQLNTLLARSSGPGRAGMPEQPRPLIHSAVLAIMADIGPIAKTHLYQDTRADGEPGETFNFRLIDEMTAALQPLLIKHNVYATPRVIESWREKEGTLSGGVLFITRVRVGFTLVSALDGSRADEGVTEGEAHSLSQFSTNAAQTMAYKQWVWMQFCVPVLNADDPENDRDQPPVETVHTEPLTPEAEARQLDLLNTDGDEAPAKGKRGGKKTKTVNTEAPARIVPSQPLSAGSLNIIRAQLKSKTGLSEDIVAAHFNKTELSGLMQSQLGDVRDFINGWVAEGEQ